MKGILVTMMTAISSLSFAQNIDSKLATAINSLEADAQFKHAIISLYVVDSKTGKVVFDKNSQIGLAPASCQKVITSTSAFEMLGKDYRYKTSFVNGKYFDGKGGNDLYIIGSGDPTFGSKRYTGTIDTTIFNSVYINFQRKKMNSFHKVYVNDITFGNNAIPRGWIWEDIANYYGAGAHQLNWKENQYDIIFSSGIPGMPSRITSIEPKMPGITFNSAIVAGKVGSGDNGYAFFMPAQDTILLQGTIPPNKKMFSISGATPNPPQVFLTEFENYFSNNNHLLSIDKTEVGKMFDGYYNGFRGERPDVEMDTIYNYYSPPLDSINYWFLKRSINLYGEAFVKTIAYEKTKFGTTDTGVAIIKNFWKDKGIEPSAINIIDGSGLSPANRVTTNALVTVMQYAKKQNWFSSFYYDLPEINGIKMKDGYITGVRSYTGYIKSAKGSEYTFSFIVNNFDGSAGTVREKMWKLLDILK